jgi:nitrate/nitrite-specific signal transduction histidine kinase
MWNSIRTRLTIILFGLAIGPLLLAGIILAQQSFTSEQRVAYDLQSQVAQNISSEVEAALQAIVNELSTLGSEVRNSQVTDRAQQLSILLGALSTGSYRDSFEELTLLNGSGEEQIRLSRQDVIPERDLINRSGTDEFEIPSATRSIYFSPVQLDESSGKPFLSIAIPLYEPRSVQLSAILIAKVRFETVGNLLNRIRVGEDQTVYIADANGIVLAHPDHGVRLQDLKIDLPPQPSTQRGLDGSVAILATHAIQLGNQSIYVVAEKPASKALALARTTMITIAIIIAAAISLAGFVGFQAVQQIVKPIEELAATAERITAGDLSQKATINRSDEIGALGTAFNAMTSQLRELIGYLEQRVAERTVELEESSRKIEKRASQLETIASVASSVATVHDINQLLPYITQAISDRFGFYHTGIFLLSEDKEYAVLRAANSEGGQKMLVRKHQLRVGQEGIVGFSIAQKRARIALDVGEDAVFFNNPDLPGTHSELSLPLIIGSDVIGALDVQSEQPNAFSNEDIEVLSTLANQVAVAIENARLFQQSQEALKELDNTFQRYIKTEWQQFTAKSKVVGYRANESGLEPITEELIAIKSKKNDGSMQMMPIKLRGTTLGSLNIDMGKGLQSYTEEEQSLIRTIADRLALALESARLLDESQRAAAKEQAIGEITGKIGSSINLRNVLQTAVEELGRNIPGAEIVIELTNKQGKAQGSLSGEIK